MLGVLVLNTACEPESSAVPEPTLVHTVVSEGVVFQAIELTASAANADNSPAPLEDVTIHHRTAGVETFAETAMTPA
ncbi:MAG TPA: hypothetical protein DIU15_11865, partial [Deltaproteobacteria bacterium]|nr:hypothetical protein [Deltaproteobacteria bacterium]